MCEKCNNYEECDFCGYFLPKNHFYPINTTKSGRNIPIVITTKQGKDIPIDMIEERQLKICNWCFSDMVGVPYSPKKSDYK